MQVSQWMTSAPHCVAEDERLDAVAAAGAARAVAALRSAAVVGLISALDIAQLLASGRRRAA